MYRTLLIACFVAAFLSTDSPVLRAQGTDNHTNQWDEDQIFLPTARRQGAEYGYSIAVCQDIAVVGAYREALTYGGTKTGVAYAFRYEEISNEWIQEERFLPTVYHDDDEFGVSVSVSGNVALIGADRDDFIDGVNDKINRGAAYVFTYDQGSGTWGPGQKLLASDGDAYDYFGYSVAVSGNVALIGAKNDDDGLDNSGAIYVFQLNRSSGAWTEVVKLKAAVPVYYGRFGEAVALDGDRALIGSRYQAYCFHNETSWTQKQILSVPNGGDIDYGLSVAIHGDRALVGARGDDLLGFSVGSAYMYHYTGTPPEWTYIQKLSPSDGGGDSNNFGYSLALFDDTALVGARNNDHGPTDSGAAYLFEYDTATEEWLEEAKLIASDREAGDFLGTSVALSDDAALAGAPGEGSPLASLRGSAYYYDLSEPTLVDLISFSAIGLGTTVRVSWTTACEIDTAGFHVWRCAKRSSGPRDFTRITKQIIPARGGATSGARYVYLDTPVVPGHPYWYRLEDVSYCSGSTFHDPVLVRWSAPAIERR